VSVDIRTNVASRSTVEVPVSAVTVVAVLEWYTRDMTPTTNPTVLTRVVSADRRIYDTVALTC